MGAVEGWGGVSAPRTSPELLARIAAAAKYKMTPQERFEQRVSFVYGQMSGVWTKDQVRQHMLERG